MMTATNARLDENRMEYASPRPERDEELLNDERVVKEDSAAGSKTLRLNLVLSDRSADRLKNLKKLTEASSFTEVIRNALRLYEGIVMEYENGHKVQIVDKDGKPLAMSIF
jgi:hypothetical protein